MYDRDLEPDRNERPERDTEHDSEMQHDIKEIARIEGEARRWIEHHLRGDFDAKCEPLQEAGKMRHIMEVAACLNHYGFISDDFYLQLQKDIS